MLIFSSVHWLYSGLLMALGFSVGIARGEVPYILDADSGITLPEGFDAQMVYEVPKSQGSWVAMTFDPKGRLIVSDQDDKGVFRVTLPTADQGIKVESLPGFPYEPIDWGSRKVGGAYGFHYAFDSLYMSTMKGLYRIRDTNGDDTFDEFKLIGKLNVGYEHSAHSLITSEDGKSLYLVSGNFTRVPEGTTSAQPPVWAQDALLPAIPDPSGHAVGLKAPGGWICRISPDGNDWKMIASGFRNSVDIALNREGELFTYDSDMEFDIGCPWYRPTRINHVTSAAEFGWRSSTDNWPAYFADSLGSVLDIGPGSPTAMSFGYHSNFPPDYQDKLFICDWTFGTIYMVTLKEKGASYSGTKQEFLNGSPLNIAAMRFGPDGAMYFVTGGRTTASKLYRIRYVGEKIARTPSIAELNRNNSAFGYGGMRALRHSLEVYHDGGKGGMAAVEKAWPQLGHDDRAIRHAARIAIENQSLELWQERVFAEKPSLAAIQGVIALCRHGDPSLSSRMIDKLSEFPFEKMPTDDRLALLRAYSLCFTRLGKPAPEKAASVIAKFDPFYPATDDTLNAELCRILAYFDAPTVAAKTIRLMKSTRAEAVSYDKEMLGRHEYGAAILQMMTNTPNTRNIHYAYCLRIVKSGWTLDDRKAYFGWLKDSLANSGGRSFAGYIRAIRQEAIERLDAKDASLLAELLGDVGTIDLTTLPAPQGPPGAWNVETAMKLFQTDLRGRDFSNGKKMFSAGRCIACHRFEGAGGHSGPDLGTVGNRFSIKDILVSICEPSQSISEQYMASLVTLKDGKSLYGRLIYKNDQEVGVASNPFDFSQVSKAPAGQVEKMEFSQISMMPPGMIAAMNQEEVKDLIAYLVSGGNPKHEVFQKEKE